jgi:hypothetical protein
VASIQRPFTVRLDCTHLATFTCAPPRREDIVWCIDCDGFRVVEFAYYKGSNRRLCGARTRRLLSQKDSAVVTLQCTEPRLHEGEHYDTPFSQSFSRDEAEKHRLSSASEGLANAKP